MKHKTFTVSHPKARMPITIKGESLKDALEKEKLNPDIWKPVVPLVSEPETEFNKLDTTA